MNKPPVFLIIFIALIFVLSAFAIFYVLKYSGMDFFNYGEIALIRIDGEISNSSGYGYANAFQIIKYLKDANKNDSIKAILLEINSPGGSVVASHQIVAEIRSIKKPVVAWISDVGASGAYYVASACDYIVADEGSITGSIGVISIIFNIRGLLKKLGVDANVLKVGKNKAMGSVFEKLTGEQKEMLQKILDEIYSNFKNDVLEFRKGKINPKKFEKIADGRILSAKQALEFGLIDKIGTFDDAIKIAAKLAKIKGKPRLREFKSKKTIYEELFSSGYAFGSGFKKAFLNERSFEIKAR